MRLGVGVVSSASGTVIGVGAAAGSAGTDLAASAMADSAACCADSAASRLMTIFLGLAAGVVGVAVVADVSKSFVSRSSGCQKQKIRSNDTVDIIHTETQGYEEQTSMVDGANQCRLPMSAW